jgi:putative ABC transport system ATP-binding protein
MMEALEMSALLEPTPTPVPPAGGRQVAVSLRGVLKHFGDGETRVQALRGVDLDVYAGELLFIAGPSGCGKTTLISIIAGILEASAGSVSVLGRDLGALTGRALSRFRRDTVGFVFQQLNLLPSLTAQENAAVPLLIAGVERAKALEDAREALDRVGLGSRTRSLPRELSGGQQQRVAIARALVHRPRIVVCDEPTSALDGRTGRQVMELLRGAALDGDRTLIVVTHDARVFSYADRIAEMNDGLVVALKRPEESALAH